MGPCPCQPSNPATLHIPGDAYPLNVSSGSFSQIFACGIIQSLPLLSIVLPSFKLVPVDRDSILTRLTNAIKTGSHVGPHTIHAVAIVDF
jgi:hypothetical protein